MSFREELKRRNVFRAGIAYTVAARLIELDPDFAPNYSSLAILYRNAA